MNQSKCDLFCKGLTLRFATPFVICYWQMCDVELSCELRHLHSTHGVGVGQAIEAMGHQITVVAQQSGWDPNTCLGKMFASLEMSFASEHDILGIHASGERIGEDLYMAVEEREAWGRRIAPAIRKRKFSSSRKE